MSITKFMTNQQGAKIYADPMQHVLLPIPMLQSVSEQGMIYRVLSAGLLSSQRTPMVTIEKDGSVIAYRLPDDYRGWVMNSMLLALADSDKNLFPNDIEFGCIESEKYYYAKIV